MDTFVLALHLMIASGDCSQFSEPKPVKCSVRYELHYPIEAGLTKEQCDKRLAHFKETGYHFKEFVGVPWTTTLSMTCS